MDVISYLQQLSEAEGISSHETSVGELIRQNWEPFVDEIQTDKLGNIIARKRGGGEGNEPRPHLMLAAHMDEIGLRVTGIEKGFLRITSVGGTDRRVLPGLEVIVHSRQGERDLPGVVATRPPHVLPPDERRKTAPWDRLFVDVGLPPEEVEQLVAVGDLISIRRDMITLKNRYVAGKAMDNRASVAAVTLTLEQLHTILHPWDVVAVATIQEETGLKGATTAAYGVAPQLAIALDVTFGEQAHLSNDETLPLDAGPSIGFGPNFHPQLVARLEEVAKAHEIPYHREPIPGRSGTDAWAIQVSREGVPTGLLSIPVRYMHQPIETLAVADIERTARLLTAFIASLETDFLEKLAWKPATEGE